MTKTSSRNVLVVGGAGYVGSHVSKNLAEAGFTPVVYDNLSAGYRNAVRWGPLVVADTRDTRALHAALEAHTPLAVLHFAACIEVGAGQRDPDGFWNNNVSGTLSLLSAMRSFGVSRLVFSSTCATYGEPLVVPISENEKQKPESVYGRTKLAAEMLITDFVQAYGMQAAILRYFNAAGADPDGLIGEEHQPETHLIPNALRAAAGLSGPLQLYGDDYDTPDGTCLRDYIHVSDLAEAHRLSLARLMEHRESFDINVGSGSGTSVRQVLRAIERETGHEVPHEVHPRRQGDVARLIADPAKACRLLGFKTKRSDINIIVRDAWKYHSARW